MFVLIGQNLHGTVTDVNQIDQHFNPLAASHHIVTKRPERFLFIVACFNIPAKRIWQQWNVFHTVTSGLCGCKIIHDRINPGIANQIQIWIFINDGYQVLFCISTVTKDDDKIFAVKFRYNLPDHGGCQFQFRLFFLSHTITKRNGKIRYFSSIPDRYAEHDTHKAVFIQIVGTVVCGMVKQF